MNARRRAVAAALLSLALLLELPAPVPRASSPSAGNSVLRASAMAAAPPRRPHAALPPPKRLVSPPLMHAPTLAELQPVPRPHDGGGLRHDLPGPVVAHDSRHAPPDPHAMLAPSAQRSGPGRKPSTGVRQGSPAIAPGVRRATSVVGGSGCNATPSSAPSLVLADQGTGINPWWRFLEGPIPGVGRYYVNVATQNFMIQADDMDVHNAGIDLAFRRTANSLSRHDVNGTDGATPTEVGSAWTSTFDAHLAGNTSGGLTVSDIDGARYDYSSDGQGNWTSSTPGQYATLTTADGGATYQWTKKSGSAYIFAGPFVNNGNSYEAYNGRLLKIYGRNRNTFIRLTYYWVCGDAASNANLAEIDASTQAGVTAKLYFGSFAGHQLLSRLVWPDGKTTVTYNYTAGGVLVNVQKPGPNNSGAMANEIYVFTAGHTMIESPRYVASNGAEGGYLNVSTSATTRQFLGMQSVGVMNFTPSDTTNVPLQSGVSMSQMQYNYTTLRNVSTGINEVNDTNGHDAYYYFDASNRVNQVSDWSGSQWLATFYGWDTANNLVADVDARGYETDYAYDANGNTIAVAKPAPTPGAFRPTSLFSYDAFNNVTAICDPNATHANQLDWTTAPAPTDTLCPKNALATRLIWSNPASGPVLSPSPAYEPFGQLDAIVTPGTIAAPNGYTRSITYSPAQQGGTDVGLPTSVTGTAVSQNDAQVPTRTPQQTYTYDAQGNVLCYGNGIGMYALQYDTLGRRTMVADPDDGSGQCSNATSATRTASFTAYYPDGAVQYTETPVQHAASVAAGTPGSAGHTFTYDLDGDELTESFPSETAGTANIYTKWYDGADRLVEANHGLATRYLYDLTQGGTVSVTGSSPFSAYGNLYTRLIRNGSSSWIEQDAAAFDALDREVTKFRYAYNCSGCAALNAATSVYDDPAVGLGLLASTMDETGVKTSHTYDGLGRPVAIAFSDSGVTSPRQYSYDADGHIVTATSAVSGTDQFSYDAEGKLMQRIEGAGITSPATYSYLYYPDGLKSTLSVQSPALSGSIAYAYRADQKRSSLGASWNGSSAGLTWVYTTAGRELAQNDTWGSKTQTYDVNGLRSSLTVPAGTFTNLQYDNEGNVTGMNAYGLTTTRSYDGIGELLSDKNSPLTCSVSLSTSAQRWNTYQYASGSLASVQTIVPNCNNNTLNGSTTTYQSDVRAGAAGSTMTPLNQPSPPPKYAGSCTNTPQPYNHSSYAYDAAGRQTGNTGVHVTYQQTGTCMFLKSMTSQSDATTYDAEGHELQYTRTPQGSGTYTLDTMQWGVNGHPAIVGLYGQATVNLHWDGDDLLFASTTAGALEQFNVEKSLVVQSGSTPIITDRDMSGIRISEHGSAGVDGLCAPQNVYGQTKCGQVAGALGEIVYDRTDGFSIGHGTVQGRRTYDAGSSQWTVPDAYKGDISDPVSQRPYMWNRNSPYSYSDPSGYVPSFDDAWASVREGPRLVADASNNVADLSSGLVDAFMALQKSQDARGILDDAAKKKGNYDLGSGTEIDADELGVNFLGRGWRPASEDPSVKISADGTRVYRGPQLKNNGAAAGKTQANFTRRVQQPNGKWLVISSGHFTISRGLNFLEWLTRESPWFYK